MIKNFDTLLQKVKKLPNKTVAIAAAHTYSALEAAVEAHRENIADSLLIGDKAFILDCINENAPKYTNSFEIIDTGKDLQLAALEAVKAVRAGKADILAKGKCDTATLMKAVLDKENGLQTGEILSDVLVYEHPDRLILLSDGGINLYPSLEDKVSILKNSVKVAHGLECETPKVALLAAVEVVNKKMQSTIDAAEITRMYRAGQIEGCIVDGPMAFDLAISEVAARIKGFESHIAGKADILIVPNIEAGNIFGKALTYYCRYRVAHVVMGAKVPILISSRADFTETKKLSMVLGVMSV
ncbi:MAG: phosphate acetyltransferase [Candidatus Cloacimonas sp. 4484_143]|nr:MAG: phosphate acetyltransferase [Candidatus Cloacimonas sp. 4484_143]RLC53476.1 MAG: phosphate acetyltransferase [Candidatus Cloacimonadota bacterium]